MVADHPAVARVRATLATHALDVKVLSDSARTALEAAAALDIEVGQIASSIVFRLPDDSPLLVVTSGRHRVDTNLVGQLIGEKLGRADADFVRNWSGFAIGGVAPTGWQHDGSPYSPRCLVDEALGDYTEVWAAAGHPHAVFRTRFAEIVQMTHGTPAVVSAD